PAARWSLRSSPPIPPAATPCAEMSASAPAAAPNGPPAPARCRACCWNAGRRFTGHKGVWTDRSDIYLRSEERTPEERHLIQAWLDGQSCDFELVDNTPQVRIAAA